METWKVIAILLGPIALVLSIRGLVADIRRQRMADRLDRETYEKRPVIPDDKMAILRPGDTCIVLCQLENMTVDQQTRLIESLTEMVSHAKERGVEFIIIPEYGGQKIFVVSRSELAKQTNHGGNSSANDRQSSEDGESTG